jgi:hypothetical protein
MPKLSNAGKSCASTANKNSKRDKMDHL